MKAFKKYLSAYPYAHGIMFHYFHNEIHPPSQGSITQEQCLLLFESIRSSVIQPEEWIDKFRKGRLCSSDICITFDHGLLSQYDIAYPILQRFGMRAFWFVNTVSLNGEIEHLELYRYFRNTCFKTIEDFYKAFFFALSKQPFFEAIENTLHHFNFSSYLNEFHFYTYNDRKYRYIRDKVLTSFQYHLLMSQLMMQKDFDVDKTLKKIWMGMPELKKLSDEGHIIGLHGHSHPTQMGTLSFDEQKREYTFNDELLVKLLGKKSIIMAHPNNSYNQDTLKILQKLGIEIGFRSNMIQKESFTALEQPRQDHTILIDNLFK